MKPRFSNVQRIIAVLLFIFSTQAVYSENTDLIFLLDTSESVFHIFDDLVDFINEYTFEKNLQQGDNLHLLSFADTPQFEKSAHIKTSDDIETVLAYMFLLQPLGNYTDLLSALHYLFDYTVSLPEQGKKEIVILTDGIHDPPPGSRYFFDKTKVTDELNRITSKMNQRKWEVRIVQLPVPASTQKDPEGVSDRIAEGAQESSNMADSIPQDNNIIEELSDTLNLEIEQYSEEQVHNVQVKPDGTIEPKTINWKIIFIIAGGILLILLIIFIISRTRSSFDSVLKKSSVHVSKKKAGGIIVEFIVEEQNTHIGMRNIHTLSDVERYCVGGDGSTFLIYLYPFPRCIGELTNKNQELEFHPKKFEYFPGNTNTSIQNCLNTRITAISSSGKSVQFYFRIYESPLDRINKIMRLTQHTGPADIVL